jgi:HlyD family secretion protein
MVREILLVASALALSGGCSAPETHERPFAAEPVRIAPLVDSVLATGRVRAVTRIDVSSQLSGRVAAVFVDFNDTVEEGQPLAQLDQQRFGSRVEELTAALAVARAERDSAEAALEGAAAAAEEAERDHQRKLKLRDQGSVSMSVLNQAAVQLRQAASQLKVREAAVAIHRANIDAATASLRQAQIDLERTTIRAPIAGVVIKRSIEPGQTVAASLSAPELFVIADRLGDVEVHAQVDEADIGKVRAGQPVSFSVEAYPGLAFSGHVSQIRRSPEISQGVVSYVVVVAAKNPNELMLPGMTALLEVETARLQAALQVPNAALRFQPPPSAMPANWRPAAQPRPGVWISKHGRLEHRPVELGYSDGQASQVTSGDLAEGEHVLVGYL